MQKRSTPCENSRAVHISPHNSATAFDSEKSSINANRKSTMGFPTSRQPRSCIPKMGLGSFFAEISTQTIKSLLQNSFSKDFQWHVVAQSNTCRTVSTFWQRKIWPQRHRSPIQDARFTFHTERAVSALLDRCCRRPATLLSCKLLC